MAHRPGRAMRGSGATCCRPGRCSGLTSPRDAGPRVRGPASVGRRPSCAARPAVRMAKRRSTPVVAAGRIGLVSHAPLRPLPVPTPETKHFWDGTMARELRLQRCGACGSTYFPPQSFCPRCLSDDVEVVRSSGRGFLYSYVISHLAAPGFEAPYVIGVVELEEGPRLLTNIVDVPADPDQLRLDLL